MISDELKREEVCRLTDLQYATLLQREIDEMVADQKAFLGIILNLANGMDEPTVLQFNDSRGYLFSALKAIRENATWKTKGK